MSAQGCKSHQNLYCLRPGTPEQWVVFDHNGVAWLLMKKTVWTKTKPIFKKTKIFTDIWKLDSKNDIEGLIHCNKFKGNMKQYAFRTPQNDILPSVFRTRNTSIAVNKASLCFNSSSSWSWHLLSHKMWDEWMKFFVHYTQTTTFGLIGMTWANYCFSSTWIKGILGMIPLLNHHVRWFRLNSV